MAGDGRAIIRQAIGNKAETSERKAENMEQDGRLLVNAKVDTYPWGGDYRPRTEAQLFFVEGVGFRVHMRCYETEIRAEYQKPDEAVYQDSCMECFLNFYPDESAGYLNFEVNANGVMLCQFGENKYSRTFIRQMGYTQPEVKSDRAADYWEIEYTIPLELIQNVYGKSEFPDDFIIKGNFYKCGDLTSAAHYGCWNPIDYVKPNFHLPEFFGEISSII